MRDFEHELLSDEQIAVDQGVERVADGALGRAFDRDHAAQRFAAAHGVEDSIDGRGLAVASGEAEEMTGRHVAERGFGAEESDGHRSFEREAPAR